MSEDIPKNEEPLYEDLTKIRQQLSTLKKDRSNFIKSKDVSTIYNQVLLILNKLEILRDGQENQPNRVDYLVDDIFQLLSLCYMTVGLTQTAPLTYASLSTVQRLLEHLEESGVYTSLELQPIKERLDKFGEIIRADLEDDSLQDEMDSDWKIAKRDEYKLLTNKLNKCLAQFQLLVDNISKFSPDLQETLSSLVTIRRKLMNLITREDIPYLDELTNLKNELLSIESSKTFIDTTLDLKTDEGGTLLNGLLDDCHTLISDLSVSNIGMQIDPSLKNLYDQLIKIKNILENLLVTRRWTLRETDLFTYQKNLQIIDNNRKNGLFLNNNGEAPQLGQKILLYILRRCYAIIYKLLESSEPISEALQPIHNQLSTVRRCLLDVKRMGGISSIRELYPYQLKLLSIDNLREDGKFMYDDQIPEGQGALNLLLLECFDIVHELKVEFYDNNEDEDDAKGNEILTTKSELAHSDSYDGDDDEEDFTDGESHLLIESHNRHHHHSDIEASMVLGEDDDDEEEGEDGEYYLPSYAASINESEMPTDIEK